VTAGPPQQQPPQPPPQPQPAQPQPQPAQPQPAQPQPQQQPPKADRDAVLAVYNRMSARHQSHVTIMWQAPALGLTAQAFLLAISLSADAAGAARAGAAALGCVVVLMSMQLMAKHRIISRRDDQAIRELEAELGVTSPLDAMPLSPSLWGGRLSSYLVWQAGLALFAAVDVVVLGAVLVESL
jgi:hypothetical protein